MHRTITRLLSTAAIAMAAAVAVGAGGVAQDPVGAADPDRRAGDAAVTGRIGLGPTLLAGAEPAALSASSATDRVPPPRPVPARRTGLAAPALTTAGSSEGWLVANGGARDPVPGVGPTVRWTLEVEPATGVDVADALTTAQDALFDGRSWARDHELVRVDDPTAARVRVLIATPATVDGLCARAGLRTNGYFSCWNGRIAALNADRWLGAVPHVDDLRTYQRYVVNHEFGHALGRAHRACTGTGDLAPVMQQQTRSLDGCVANAWPFPAGGG